MSDPIIEMVREGDPARCGAPPTELQTEAALRRVLADARHRRRSRRRRLIPLTVALGAALAAAALAIANPGSGPGGAPGTGRRPTLAEARAILRGAAAGLALPAGSVQHVADSATQTFPRGGSTSWTDEWWQETSSPYDERYLWTPAGEATRETAIADGRQQLYDPTTNTIYTNPSPPPFTLAPATQPGLYRLSLDRQTITVSAAQLQALRDGQDTIAFTGGPPPSVGRAFVTPYAALASPPFDVRSVARSLLQSGRAQVQEGVQFAGQPAIEISDPDGMRLYYVAPSTYQPLGMVERFDGNTVTVRFTTYESLAGTVANRQLVTLEGAHPTARIDTSAADYDAASNRIFR